MSQTPSPTSSPGADASNTLIDKPPISTQVASEDAAPATSVKAPGVTFKGAGAAGTSGEGRRTSIQFAPNTFVKTPNTSTQPGSGNANPQFGVKRPSIAFGPGTAGASGDGRRASLQFAPGVDSDAQSSKPKAPPLRLPRRMSSPPPRQTYEPQVSFNTFDNKDATNISFTLVCKHKDYVYTNRSRTFLCGADEKEYSMFALEWLIEELVDDGDQIVCLRVVDKDSKIASEPSVQQGIYKEEGRELLETVQNKNRRGKAVSLVLELAVGKVPDTIQRMILLHEPISIVVGTRGRALSGISSLLPSGTVSISKYCLAHSPVPVVIVRSKEQREASKAKRMANGSKKQGYDTSILGNNPGAGAGEGQNSPEANEEEAAAVAKAIGLKQGNPFAPRNAGKEKEGEGASLSRTASVKSDVGTEESPSPTGPLVMDDDDLEDVPEMEGLALGSPVDSEVEEGGAEK